MGVKDGMEIIKAARLNLRGVSITIRSSFAIAQIKERENVDQINR